MPTSLTLPLDEETVRSLHVGDEVLFSGRMITARDAAHRHLVRALDPVVKRLVEGRFLYHCGPVVAQDPVTHAWRFAAAGPATSMREEPYQADVIARYGARGVVGKGGMGPATSPRSPRTAPSTCTPSARSRSRSRAASSACTACTCSTSSASARRSGTSR